MELRSIKKKILMAFQKHVLPLYGRKFVVASFASVMFLIGVPWEALEQGVYYIIENNKFFHSDNVWFYGILGMLMMGQVVDHMTTKKDDISTCKDKASYIWKYIKTKTEKMFEPRPFVVWMFIAILFIVGIVDDEALFYFSSGYVGVNSAEAIIEHVRTVKSLKDSASPTENIDAI